MSWFDTKSFSKYAKSALKQAQKNIDKVLDINEEGIPETTKDSHLSTSTPKSSPSSSLNRQPNIDDSSFFDSFLTSDSSTPPKRATKLVDRKKPQSNTEKWDKFPDDFAGSSDSQKQRGVKKTKSDTSKKNNIPDETLKVTETSTFVDVSVSELQTDSLVEQEHNNKAKSLDCKTDAEKNNHSTSSSPGKFTDKSNDNGKDKDVQPKPKIDVEIKLNQEEDENHMEVLHDENNEAEMEEKNNTSPINSCNNSDNNKTFNSNIRNQETDTLINNTANENNIAECIMNDANSTSNLLNELYDKSKNSDIVKNSDIDDKSNEESEHHEKLDSDLINEIALANENTTFEKENKNVNKENVMLNVEEMNSEQNATLKNKENESNENIDLNLKVEEEDSVHNNISESESKPVIRLTDSIHNELNNEFNEREIYKDREEETIDSKTEKQIEELRSVIEARENRLLELSKENIELSEDNANLKKQLQDYALASDDNSVEAMREEFSKRLAELDSKFKAAIKEKDILKEQLTEMELKKEQSEKDLQVSLSSSLAEKEETIRALLEEGEVLSKKELDRNTKIKKLHAKLKDTIAKLEKSETKNTELTNEVTELKVQIGAKDEEITSLKGELKKAEKIGDSQEDEITSLKEKIEDDEEKYKTMETTLQNAYSEINRLNLEKAQKESEANEAAGAIAAKLELQEKIKALENKASCGREELLSQLDDLQVAYSVLEKHSSRQEEHFKREIQSLHRRMEETETRNEELSHSVSSATKPLLRQITNLQSSHSKQAENWEEVEMSLTQRLGELQHQVEVSAAKERSATEIAVQLRAKHSALEGQYRTAKRERRDAQDALEEEEITAKKAHVQFEKQKTHWENEMSSFKLLCEKLSSEKTSLESQLESERVRHESELLNNSESITLMNSGGGQLAESFSSRRSSVESNKDSQNEAPPLLRQISSTSSHYYDTPMRGATQTTASFEQLNARLRKRDGECFQLQEEVVQLEKTKASLAQELVNLSLRVDQLEQCEEKLSLLSTEHKALSGRYEAILTMYGEKEEENEELKMDLQDVKSMYKQQISELLLNR